MELPQQMARSHRADCRSCWQERALAKKAVSTFCPRVYSKALTQRTPNQRLQRRPKQELRSRPLAREYAREYTCRHECASRDKERAAYDSFRDWQPTTCEWFRQHNAASFLSPSDDNASTRPISLKTERNVRNATLKRYF